LRKNVSGGDKQKSSNPPELLATLLDSTWVKVVTWPKPPVFWRFKADILGCKEVTDPDTEVVKAKGAPVESWVKAPEFCSETSTTPEKGAKFTQSWLMEVMARCSSSPMANRQIQIMVWPVKPCPSQAGEEDQVAGELREEGEPPPPWMVWKAALKVWSHRIQGSRHSSSES
jgi:hypothetical protein